MMLVRPNCFSCGGVPLGSKQSSSSGVDVVDVLHVLAAFQTINNCQLTCLLRVNGTDTKPVLELEVIADPLDSVAAEPAPLGSWRSTLGSMTPRTLEAGILQALYGLDADLAEKEFARAIDKERSIPAKA